MPDTTWTRRKPRTDRVTSLGPSKRTATSCKWTRPSRTRGSCLAPSAYRPAGLRRRSRRFAIRLRPEHSPTWNLLGVPLARQRKPSEAEACFRRVLQLQPGHPEATRNLERARREQMDSADAGPAGSGSAGPFVRRLVPAAHNHASKAGSPRRRPGFARRPGPSRCRRRAE